MSDRDDLERSLSRMVKAAREEEWTDNRIMLASAAFMTRVDGLRPTVTPEQVEALKQSYAMKVQDFARETLRTSAALRQQPEPVTDAPHDGDFYDQFCREVEAQHIAADLPAAAVVGICTRMAHKAQRKVIERLPEPVSQDELGALVIRWWTSEHAVHVLTRELLSQYAITRKPQGGA